MTKLIDLFYVVVFFVFAVACIIMTFVHNNLTWMPFTIGNGLISLVMYFEFKKLYKET